MSSLLSCSECLQLCWGDPPLLLCTIFDICFDQKVHWQTIYTFLHRNKHPRTVDLICLVDEAISFKSLVIYLLNHTGIWQWHTTIMHTIWTMWWCWWKVFRTSSHHSSTIIITPLFGCIHQHLVLQTSPDLSEDWTTLVHLSPHTPS